MAVPQSIVEDVIADGAHSREAVTRACRAGGDCGACHGMIEDMIEDHLESCGGCPNAAGSAPAAQPDRLVAAERLARPHHERAA